ncbi:NADH-quinone oxidoreductase subunit G [Candidatus Cyrtobacter comes]|uniref:NADH-quinone oxidoreductase n=1 Tax=Candidatus Cyrtobacter comes TaxID=675776 RepID=A0ABU5L6A7_9RICK|nr:NADH-quinone oxidoreductase subunit NuoG [Candidatus Cyrtobacter comes]MDZ5761655.1 NADH-quinone oxidoreductase subunit G [Candidatus Cyrtobacter comes]
MPKLFVDGMEVLVSQGTTVMQACELAGVEIPRFCYHEKLKIAGNCRMCLVEIEKTPKPVASCAQPVVDGMVVHTNTAKVKEAREGVMEFLLINHPLDCPICDQGGECDLQDQAVKYGRAYSRFEEEKRVVADKDMGPLIQTNMTRCIHCTRCVRFLEEIAGTEELGAIGRGKDMAISAYIENSIKSELSGNIVDLCPVGALTSKPYAYKARSWELKKTESIDVMDAVGSNIRIDSRAGEVMRILPRRNDLINEEWISDKTRFAFDGLRYQRLDRPMLLTGVSRVEISWDEALEIARKRITDSGDKVGAIAGDFTDLETMFSTKNLLESLGSKMYDCRDDLSQISNSYRGLYTFGTKISDLEKADLCLIVGSNPRIEASIINARLRKAYVENKMEVALIGKECLLNYEYDFLGDKGDILKDIAAGNHSFCKKLENASNPVIILGSSVFGRDDYKSFLYYALRIAKNYNIVREDWNGFNILQRSASRVGGLDIGFLNQDLGVAGILKNSEVLILLASDNLDVSLIPDHSFVIYQGHHGTKLARRANLILPGSAYVEKTSSFVNTEGVIQQTNMAVYPPGEARNDCEIINSIASLLGIEVSLPAKMRKIFLDLNVKLASANFDLNKIITEFDGEHAFSENILESSIENFYRCDTISMHSKIMESISVFVSRN